MIEVKFEKMVPCRWAPRDHAITSPPVPLSNLERGKRGTGGIGGEVSASSRIEESV